jgi:hypothetical protein
MMMDRKNILIRIQFFILVITSVICIIPTGVHAQSKKKLKVKFVYEGQQIGGGNRFERVVLKQRAENETISKILLKAAQSLQHTFSNQQSPGFIQPAQNHVTDIVPLDVPETKSYNANVSNARFKIPEDRYYGIQYQIAYKLKDKEIELSVSSILYQKGSASPFIKYTGTYSDDLFFDRFVKALNKAIDEMFPAQ